ncbi:hypothetical protein HDU81_011345, partial [Chytriomyces hyalinus]
GMTVLYGDTDLVFISVGSLLSDRQLMPPVLAKLILDDFHLALSGTIFTTVRLKYKHTYETLVLIKPKLYYGLLKGTM